MIIFLTFGVGQVHADNVNDVYVQNIKIQPSTIKVGDAFIVTITLVNNSTVPVWLDGGKCSSADTNASFFTVIFDNHAKIKAKDINCAGVGWSQKLDPGKNNTATSPDYTVTYIATEPGTANATMTFSYHVINQTDAAQPGFSQNISKSFLFTILDNNTGTKMLTETILSPLEQLKLGIPPENVHCNQGFQLILKREDTSPACVKPDTAQKLIERGWAEITVTKASFDVIQSNTTQANSMIDLGNDTGIVNWKNQTYYFETPNYTKTTYVQPVHILFHDVLFTLFPSEFGGLPLGGCEGIHYLTDTKFSDGASEMLHVFVSSPSCGYDYTPIKLSTHTNPQAGLIFYDGKMKLLTSVENK